MEAVLHFQNADLQKILINNITAGHVLFLNHTLQFFDINYLLNR